MKNFLIVLTLAFFSPAFAQYDRNWFFGTNCGLSFSTSPPSILTGQSSIPDNCSTISDANGNLLFYSDGNTVWNKFHVVMQNGSGLLGNYTAGQCALIVPVPCSQRYVIFTPTEFASPGTLYYSYVDMSANGGVGAVESSGKNISLGNGWTEKLCACYNAAGNFFWVLTHKWNSDQFVALKVTSAGVSTQSVISAVGAVHSCGFYSGAHDAMGQLTISRDGTKVANAVTCQDFFELFDFNLQTGQLSNAIQLNGHNGKAWGTAFSPDSRKLYTNSIFGADVYQFDLSNYTAQAIAASEVTVGTSGSGGYSFGYMELGPDQKLYIARPNMPHLTVINNPNNMGAACNFSLVGLQLSTGSIIQYSSWGISRVAYNIPAVYSGNQLTYSVSPSPPCYGQSVLVTVSPSGNYNWSNGSAGSSSTFTYFVPVTLTVTSQVPSACASSTVVSISGFTPVNISYNVNPSPVCYGKPVIVSLAPAGNYSWSNGASGSSSTFTCISPVSITVTQQGVAPCPASTVISVSGFSTSNISYTIQPNPACYGHTVSVNLSPSVNYNWSNGSTGATSTLIYSGPVTLTVSGQGICPASTLIPITGKECNGVSLQEEQLDHFRIFPNPVQNELYINSSFPDIIISDFTGRIVLQMEMPEGKIETILNISELNPGLYVVRNGRGPGHVIQKL